MKAAPATPPWRPVWLLAAPHRLAFFLAAGWLVLSAVWWGLVLVARSVGLALPWAVPASAAHGLLMSLAFMPLFFVGFLFTAGPKWLQRPEVAARSLLPGLACMVAGWGLVLLGFHTHALVCSAGMGLVAAGWTGLSVQFARMVRASREPDRVHARLVVVASAVGALAMWSLALALGTGEYRLLLTATQVGLWGFVATIFAVVSHRMVPFFGASAAPFMEAVWSEWLLWVMLAMLWLQGAFYVAELWLGPLSAALRWSQVALELPAALLLLGLAVRWARVQSLSMRLIAMLHGGFAWLGISMALSATSHTLMALSDGTHSLGLAPLHAMTMGYLGATMFAMTTRVSSGHGGRPVAADNTVWVLYWVLQLAVLLRVMGALWSAASTPLVLLAIAAWTAATLGWALRYGLWFGRPRLDGRPG